MDEWFSALATVGVIGAYVFWAVSLLLHPDKEKAYATAKRNETLFMLLFIVGIAGQIALEVL
jgi:hypothetical protein